MATVPIIELADAVVDALNRGGWAFPFTAERKWAPEFGLAELQTLRVSVIPASDAESIDSRSTTQDELQVLLSFQKQADPNNTQEIDALVGLVQAVRDSFRFGRLGSESGYVWTKTEHDPVADAEHLRQHRCFTSIVVLTFKVRR